MNSTFRVLKQIIARLFGRRPPASGPPQGPYAGVREPRKRGPGGRDVAAAVMEPEPDPFVRAVGQMAGGEHSSRSDRKH
jgi:hypothetical protein